MLDFIFFRRMLTPIILQLLFWVTTILCIITGIADLFNGEGILVGLQVLILGPLLARVICEFLILFFTMNETLTDLKNLKKPSSNPEKESP